MKPPTIDDIRAAARRIAAEAYPTPLVESAALNERFGGRLLFKAETLQRTNSFKFRGAFNMIAAISEADRKRGVVAFSSGNHAQGVAAAAAIFGIEAVILMPADAPAIKRENVLRMGGKVIPFDRFSDDRMALAKPYMDQGMTLVPPYEHPHIVAGQGTIGLEIVEETRRRGIVVDAVLIPAGGGGLSSGVALAVKDSRPETQVWVVEPEHFDDTRRSLEAGRHVSNEPGHASICDAILTSTPGTITLEINRNLLAGGIAVTDREVEEAMREAATHLKLVIEPGGCVGFAAITSGRFDARDRVVVVVLSGGNVDPDAYAAILAGGR